MEKCKVHFSDVNFHSIFHSYKMLKIDIFILYLSLQYLVVAHPPDTVSPKCYPLSQPVDVLFVLDSTTNIGGPTNHRIMLEFVADFIERILLLEPGNGNRLALAQFTPDLRVEISFIEATNLIESSINEGQDTHRDQLRTRLMNVPYVPCILLCSAISLNTIVRTIFGDQIGYRPCVIVLISTVHYHPTEIHPDEVPFRPRGPLHLFVITVGQKLSQSNNGAQNLNKPPSLATTTAHLSVNEFQELSEMVAPLCQSVHSFLGENDGATSTSMCLLCLLLTTIGSILLIAVLSFGIFRFRKDSNFYKQMMLNKQEKLNILEKYYQTRENSELERTLSHLPADHPALQLPPVDVLFLVDASNSISNTMFEQVKEFLCTFIDGIDLAPGRSRIALILFANNPTVQFDFDRYYTARAIKEAIHHMPYLGGGTRLAKALIFAAGILARNQSRKMAQNYRPQMLILVSDGASDDHFDQEMTHLHDKLHIKIAAVATKQFFKERLRVVTRYDGAVFTLNEPEALSIWLWNQQVPFFMEKLLYAIFQKLWMEHHGTFSEREMTQLTGGN